MRPGQLRDAIRDRIVLPVRAEAGSAAMALGGSHIDSAIALLAVAVGFAKGAGLTSAGVIEFASAATLRESAAPPNLKLGSFSYALACLRLGLKVCRSDWHPGRWLRLNSGFIVDECPELQASRDWPPSVHDLLANDWAAWAPVVERSG